jgi:hypothetical protein
VNPKDSVGAAKLPLHLWPLTATAAGCLGLLEGKMKYGRANWRAIPIQASIYKDALDRHMGAWFEGEDIDPDSGLPHLWKALSCLAVLVDAEIAGNVIDDRCYPGGYADATKTMTAHVARLQAQYADRPEPHHYTIGDEE